MNRTLTALKSLWHRVSGNFRCKQPCCILTAMLLISGIAFSQDEKSRKEYPTYQSFNVSYNFGGQVYNDNFIYNPGFAVSYSIGKQVHEDVAVGLGGGYLSLSKERFVPLFIEVYGNKKSKENAPFIRFQAGYSLGWNDEVGMNQNYELEGGAYINLGMGRRIVMNDKLTMLFHWSYCHQFAEMEYNIFNGADYSEVLNYDMLQISLGIILN